MKLYLNKKINIVILAVFIFGLIFLFTSAKHARAAVPVVEIGNNVVQNTISAGNTTSLVTKEFVSDSLATKVAKTAINAFTASVVNWINSGFQGNPAFVTDLKGFLLDVADAETSHFIEELGLTDLCSPWSLNIRIALSLPQNQFQREVACTLSDIVANMDDFINGDFSQGGWAGWFELTTRPQNNPYGLYLITSSELDQRIAGTQQERTQLLNWGNGFLSYEKCEELPPGFVGPPRCEIVTPGSVIEEQLGRVLGTNLSQLELADEFNEVVTALLGQLVQQAMGGLTGLRGASQSINGRPPLTSQIGGSQGGASLSNVRNNALVDIGRDIKNETDYRDIKQSTLNSVIASENLLFTLQACYAGKLGDNLSLNEKATAQQRMNNASVTVSDKITKTKTALESDIALSNKSIATLNQLKASIISAGTAEEINNFVNDLTSLRRNGDLGGIDIYGAQQEQSTITAQMSSLDATTNAQITECQNFPPPPPVQQQYN